MILPTKNISIMDVRNAVGYPSTDLGTLCSCPNVNIWSRFKPVRHDFTFSRPSDWYKDMDGTFGITVKTHASLDSLMADILAGTEQYTHFGPIGGASSPYRLGDFAGYDTEAEPPLFEGTVPSMIYGDQESVSLTPMRRTPSSTEITVDELYAKRFGGSRYFGVAFRRDSDGETFWMTSSTPGLDSITVPIRANKESIFRSGTFKAVQFLTQRKRPSFTSSIEGSGYFALMPGAKARTVTFKTSTYVITITARWNASTGAVSGEIHGKSDATSHAFTDVSVNYTYGGATGISEAVARQTLADFTIPARGEYRTSYTSKNNVLPDFRTRGGKVWLVANGNDQAQAVVMMQMETT